MFGRGTSLWGNMANRSRRMAQRVGRSRRESADHRAVGELHCVERVRAKLDPVGMLVLAVTVRRCRRRRPRVCAAPARRHCSTSRRHAAALGTAVSQAGVQSETRVTRTRTWTTLDRSFPRLYRVTLLISFEPLCAKKLNWNSLSSELSTQTWERAGRGRRCARERKLQSWS